MRKLALLVKDGLCFRSLASQRRSAWLRISREQGCGSNKFRVPTTNSSRETQRIHHCTTNSHYVGQEPPSHVSLKKKKKKELKLQNCIRRKAETLVRIHNGYLCVSVNEGLTRAATVQQSRVTDLHGAGGTQPLLFQKHKGSYSLNRRKFPVSRIRPLTHTYRLEPV